MQKPNSLLVKFLNTTRVVLALVISCCIFYLGALAVDSLGLSNSSFGIAIFCVGPAIFTVCFLMIVAIDWNEQATPKDYWQIVDNKFEISWWFVATRFYRTLYGAGVVLVVQLPVYVTIRFVWGCIEWLKTGILVQNSSCEFLQIFCNNNTDALGLNKILNWIGYSDAIYPLIPLMLIGLLFLNLSDRQMPDAQP